MSNVDSIGIDIEDAEVVGVDISHRELSLKKMLLRRRLEIGDAEIPILNGVTFSARPGDRVGIVGPNGSGKSSLLKVIAGIYPISRGRRWVCGTIAPIIEMGLGFDPELSGRENIKLGLLYSGQLNRHSADLEDEIIGFSGLAGKVDWPVKIYSSGMKARLAFSVAFFQNSDILLLDEVFAVGDESFLAASRRRLEERFHGATISILVSHDHHLIREMCNRCLRMADGRIVADDLPQDVLH